jgi:pimeloyl-ACP methyl ester carboxylesterase
MTAAAGSLSPRYASLFPPTMVMAGDSDQVVDYRQAQRLHGMVPGSQLDIYRGGSHMIHYLDPARFVRGIDSAHHMISAGTAERI